MDINDIKKKYEEMSDDEFVRIVTTNAGGLRPEVFEIIESEVNKRKFNPDIFQGVLSQNREYAIEEIEQYSNYLRDLPCPICKSTSQRLNGTISHKLYSIILFTTTRKEVTIACPNCLDEKNNNAALSNFTIGWWSFPFGLIMTPVYMYRDFKAKSNNNNYTANEVMLSFTLSKIGLIETCKENKEKLMEIIKPDKYN